MGYKIQIGTLVLKQATIKTLSYECAAWYRDVQIEPGEYPIFAYVDWTYDGGGMYRLTRILAVCPGVTVAADFTPLFAGNPIGKSRDYRGEACDATIELPTYGREHSEHVHDRHSPPVTSKSVRVWNSKDRTTQLAEVQLSEADALLVEVYEGYLARDEMGPGAPQWGLRWNRELKLERSDMSEPSYNHTFSGRIVR